MGKKSRRKKSRTAPKAPGAAPRPVEKEALAEGRAIPLWVAIVVLAVLPPVLYFNSLNNEFLYDDFHSLIDNPNIRKLENIPSFFASARTTSLHSDKGHYRPVLFSTYALSYALGGYDYKPEVFRLANIILHVLNGLLVFAVLRSLLRSPASSVTGDGRVSGNTAAAFFAALLFAVHPLNTESVNYISCRSSVLATTFYLAGVWLFVGYAGSALMRRRMALYAGSLLCFALGLLSKEIVVTLPVMLVLLDVLALPGEIGVPISRWGKPWDTVKALVRRHAAFFVVTALYGGLLVGKMLVPSYEKRDVLSNLIIQTKAMAFYLRLLVFPWGLSISHGFDTEGLLNLTFSVSLLVIGAGLFLSWKLCRRYGLLSFAVLWYFITLLPTSSVIALRVPVNEHRVYLPGIGFAVAVGFLVDYAGRRARTGRRLAPPLSRLIVPAFLAVTVVFSISVMVRNQTWKTSKRVWEDAAKKYPRNSLPHEALANIYERQGYLEKSKRERQLALRYAGKEGVPVSLSNVAAFHDASDYRNVVKAYEERLRIEEKAGNRAAMAEAFMNIGIAHGNLGDFTKALEYLEKSLEIEQELGGGGLSRLYNNMGTAHGQLGDSAKALQYFEKAVELEPKTAEVYINLARAYLSESRPHEAKIVCEKMKKLGLNVPEDLRKRLEAAANNP
ncbi:MAG: tetratricopeptide repeat protein [Acidobacteriota bacterium]|nr:MAG: tetratricopeptide repeat protein [Acidobacteriota bacterium]